MEGFFADIERCLFRYSPPRQDDLPLKRNPTHARPTRGRASMAGPWSSVVRRRRTESWRGRDASRQTRFHLMMDGPFWGANHQSSVGPLSPSPPNQANHSLRDAPGANRRLVSNIEDKPANRVPSSVPLWHSLPPPTSTRHPSYALPCPQAVSNSHKKAMRINTTYDEIRIRTMNYSSRHPIGQSAFDMRLLLSICAWSSIEGCGFPPNDLGPTRITSSPAPPPKCVSRADWQHPTARPRQESTISCH